MWIVREQRRCGHDLPRLTVAALDHFEIEPCLLHLGARFSRADALDCGDCAVANRSDPQQTRAHGVTVDVYGAGTTLSDPAAVFGAGHTEDVAQHPQQRGVTVDIYVVRRTIDFDGKGYGEFLLSRRWVMVTMSHNL
jgi:hypothetical protein